MSRWAVTVGLLAALLVSPVIAGPASAADVNVTLIAFNTNWHVGSEGAPAQPTITVAPGDVLRLRVENHDAFDHTFTFPHFSVDQPLGLGSPSSPTVIFVNITTSTADNGRWQFYCAVPGHTTGSGETRDLMVGWVQVSPPAPPPTPGFEVVLVIAALAVVVVAVRVLPRRRQ
jgi:hypothetical protein